MKRERYSNEGEVNISTGDVDITIKPRRSSEKRRSAPSEKRIDVKPGKKLSITRGDLDTLRVLLLQTYPEETQGMGEAEHSVPYEERVQDRFPEGGKVEEEDFLGAVKGIKKRSKQITVEDIADVVFQEDSRFRGINKNSAFYIGALARFSGELQPYWDAPVEEPLIIARAPRRKEK